VPPRTPNPVLCSCFSLRCMLAIKQHWKVHRKLRSKHYVFWDTIIPATACWKGGEEDKFQNSQCTGWDWNRGALQYPIRQLTCSVIIIIIIIIILYIYKVKTIHLHNIKVYARVYS